MADEVARPAGQPAASGLAALLPTAGRLALLVLLLALISGASGVRVGAGTPVTLAAGALLLSGLFAGKLARGVGLPRLTGYLLIGVVVGPHVLGFVPREGVSGLAVVKGVAVSLIALAAGSELRLGLLRRVGAQVARVCVLVSLVVLVLSAGALLALRPLLPFFAGMTGLQALAVSTLVATVVVSFSPTVTIAVVEETQARGSFTEFLMAMVILGDLVVMVAFALAAGAVRASLGGGLDVAGLLGGVGWELFGSVVVGCLFGAALLGFLRGINREVPLFLLALCLAASSLAQQVHLSELLLMLAAGALVANADPRQAERIHHATLRAGLPVFAVFFAAAGAGLQLDVLPRVGPAALVLVGVRALALWGVCRRVAPAADGRLRRLLWLGLVSQAGVTFGLAALLARTFPAFGGQVEVLIIAMVTLHELVGPVLTRRALVLSGEARAEEA